MIKEVSNSTNNKCTNKSESLVLSFDKNQFNNFRSSISKRIETYSLSNHSTMAITAMTSFSEEQTNSLDYDNTYFYGEDISKLDDISSFTTVTSNLPKILTNLEQDTSVYSDITIFHSDTEDTTESISVDIQQYAKNNNSCLS